MEIIDVARKGCLLVKKMVISAVLSHQLPFLREVLEKVKGLIQSIICRYMLYIIFCSKVFEHIRLMPIF